MKKSRLAFIALVGIIGALIFIILFGKMDVNINAFEVQLSINIIEPGYTKLLFPPLGEIKAKTHSSPIQFTVLLKNINPEIVKEVINNPDKERVFNDIKIKSIESVKKFIFKLLFLSVLGSGILGYLFKFKAVSEILVCSLIGFLIVSTFIFWGYLTFDHNAFLDPEYSGVLKDAPWIMRLAEETIASVDKLGNMLEVTAQNAYLLFEKLDELEPLESDGDLIKVLHISDIHNNVAAMDFVEQVVQSFDIDMIIDTGDITDYGTPIEGSLLNRIEKLKIPYIFIAGNHDSPSIIDKMKNLKNVKVLEEEAVEVKDISIFGIADPASKTNDIKPAAKIDFEKDIDKITNKLNELENTPQILAVHNPRTGRAFKGKVPVILYGHTHSFEIEETQGTIMINAGTTGSAGIRGLQAAKEIPYSMVLIYYDKRNTHFPKAVDVIKIYSIKKGFTLERIWLSDS